MKNHSKTRTGPSDAKATAHPQIEKIAEGLRARRKHVPGKVRRMPPHSEKDADVYKRLWPECCADPNRVRDCDG